MKILAIESSCDETAAAVVKNGLTVLSNVISSQIDIHKLYGGVVPEIASRNHIKNISAVIDEAMETANLSFEQLDAVAVTYAPGLSGALLVGVSTAKSIAYARKLPLIPVHHIAGHICANYLEHPNLKPPYICLVASGGHSHIVFVKDYCEYKILARTRDDAAGEAYDKVARVLGLGYPGGPAIENAALTGNPQAIKFPRVNMGEDGLDFSFSGVKTAVINYIHNAEQKNIEINKNDIAASFQAAVVDVLSNHLISAARKYNADSIALAGGVACNSALRLALTEKSQENNIPFYYPSPILCTDNAAMIGCAAYFEYNHGNIAELDLNCYPSMPLDNYIGKTPTT